MASEPPLILTLEMDGASQEMFGELRDRHFPPERNVVPAHLSLFNQLPGARESSISSDLEEVCRRQEPVVLVATGLLFLGKGVAYRLESPGLATVRETLTERWKPWLGPQDRQGFRPHVTVQNKVSPERARSLHDQLSRTFSRFEVRGEGLLLWRYLGGPWEAAGEFPFGG